MSGQPVVVISPNGIEYNTLKELNMNIDDLLEMIRQMNYYSLDQVAYGIIETNGKMSIIPTSSCAPVAAQDLNINNPTPQLPHVIISDGKVMKDEMKSLQLTYKHLNKILNHIHTEIKQLIILSIDKAGKLYYQLKGSNFQIIDNIFKEVNL